MEAEEHICPTQRDANPVRHNILIRWPVLRLVITSLESLY
jgi:hypothetical protein